VLSPAENSPLPKTGCGNPRLPGRRYQPGSCRYRRYCLHHHSGCRHPADCRRTEMAQRSERNTLQRRRFHRFITSHRQNGRNHRGFHPLQTLANVKQAIDNLPGSTFAIEAEEPLLTTLKEMAAALNCRWIELKAEDKVIYHAAAVIASNYLVHWSNWPTTCGKPSASPASRQHKGTATTFKRAP